MSWATKLACEANRPVLSSTTSANPDHGSAHSISARCFARERLCDRSRENPPPLCFTENRVRINSWHFTANALQLASRGLGTLVSGLEIGWVDATTITHTTATAIAKTGAYVLRTRRVPAPTHGLGARPATIFSRNWDVDSGRQGQGMAGEYPADTVARLYRLFAGKGGAEVSPIAAGGSTVRFLSDGVEVDTDALRGDATGPLAGLKSLSVDVIVVAGAATTSVTALLHPQASAGAGTDPFVAQDPDAHVLLAVDAISEEVANSCAPAAVKPRIVRAVAAYARSGRLVPAFRVVQAIQPVDEGANTRIVFANVRRCTLGFLSHLVSDVACGVTRAVYNSTTMELEMWFATPAVPHKKAAEGEAGPPAKRRKGALASVINWLF
jgi:hypothetical protein